MASVTIKEKPQPTWLNRNMVMWGLGAAAIGFFAVATAGAPILATGGALAWTGISGVTTAALAAAATGLVGGGLIGGGLQSWRMGRENRRGEVKVSSPSYLNKSLVIGAAVGALLVGGLAAGLTGEFTLEAMVREFGPAATNGLLGAWTATAAAITGAVTFGAIGSSIRANGMAKEYGAAKVKAEEQSIEEAKKKLAVYNELAPKTRMATVGLGDMVTMNAQMEQGASQSFANKEAERALAAMELEPAR